jgi:hypothetical protein
VISLFLMTALSVKAVPLLVSHFDTPTSKAAKHRIARRCVPNRVRICVRFVRPTSGRLIHYTKQKLVHASVFFWGREKWDALGVAHTNGDPSLCFVGNFPVLIRYKTRFYVARASPSISDIEGYKLCTALGGNANGTIHKANIPALYSYEGIKVFLRHLRRPSRFAKGGPYQNDAHATQQHTDERCNPHYFCPERRSALGYKVGIFASIVILAFGLLVSCFCYAVRAFRRGHSEAGMLYLCAGIAGVYSVTIAGFLLIDRLFF